MKNIVDAGPIIALFERKDTPLKRWARQIFLENQPPFYTCEAVLAEAAFMTSPVLIARMVSEGDLVVDFSLQTEAAAVSALAAKYAPRMQLADACIVRMTELEANCQVFTVDREDFSLYRRQRKQLIPCLLYTSDAADE